VRPDEVEARRQVLDLLRERSVHTGRLPTGATTAGGTGRLLRGGDGWLAVNLPRDDDLDLLPAWCGVAPPAEAGGIPWVAVARAVADRPCEPSAARAQELGLAVTVVADPTRLAAGDEQLRARGTSALPCAEPRRVAPAGPRSTLDQLVVVDLSSLWAGPTCARLLGGFGARVLKVESTERPDGARLGDPAFYAALHRGHEQRSVPFTTAEGRRELHALLASADVVIEGSRPRAFDRLGIDPDAVVAARPGVVWVSVTGYGRTGPWRDRVGFGDDCAAAGGLVSWTERGEPELVGDAVADPLTGMVAAAMVARAVSEGGGVVLDVPLREVARAAALGLDLLPGQPALEHR